MNENIKAGGDIHAGDGGYSIGTKEKYDEFVKNRNRMNERIKEVWTQAAKTTQGDSWEEQTKFMERFAELIVRECMKVAASQRNPTNLNYKPSERFVEDLRQHFGVEE